MKTYNEYVKEIEKRMEEHPLMGKTVKEKKIRNGQTELRSGVVIAHWLSHGTTGFGQDTLPVELVAFVGAEHHRVSDIEEEPSQL